MSDDQALEFLNDVAVRPLFQPGQWSQVAICTSDVGRLVGDIGIFVHEEGSQAEIGFTLARPSQGRGIATSAVKAALDLVFTQSTVKSVIAITDTRNTASIGLLRRVGMALVGTADAVFRGAPCTEHTFALSRPQSVA